MVELQIQGLTRIYTAIDLQFVMQRVRNYLTHLSSNPTIQDRSENDYIKILGEKWGLIKIWFLFFKLLVGS